MSPPDETETLRKRLKIRAWRRGIKEMDLILGGYADEKLATMTPEELALFEAMLGENDHDLYAWVTAQQAPPPRFAPLVEVLGQRAAGIRG